MEADFGAPIALLTGRDDTTDSVALSFDFPFDGVDYTTVFVGTNGDIQLGSLGNDRDIDYDHWYFMEEFTDDGAPSIAGFNSDLDLTTTGTIHFNDFGDRAVFTWNEVGTDRNETALLSFQISLYADGSILLGYNGILDDPGEDLIQDLNEGIVVGVAAGDIAQPIDPGPSGLNGPLFMSGTTAFARWCFEQPDSCGFFGPPSEGLAGPTNAAFDLDQQSILFMPVQGGFAVPEPTPVALHAAAMLALATLARRASC